MARRRTATWQYPATRKSSSKRSPTRSRRRALCRAGNFPTARCWSKRSRSNWSRAIPEAAVDWRRESCITNVWPAAKRSATSIGRATPTSGTTSKPTPSCSKTPKAATARTRSAIPNAPGGRRQQTWHFPSRTECAVCHNMAAKYVLGVQTLQMNRTMTTAARLPTSFARSSIWASSRNRCRAPPEELSRLVDYRDSARISAAGRDRTCTPTVRIVIASGAAATPIFSCWPRSMSSEIGIVDIRPGQGTFSIPHARHPGAWRSVSIGPVLPHGPGRPRPDAAPWVHGHRRARPAIDSRLDPDVARFRLGRSRGHGSSSCRCR